MTTKTAWAHLPNARHIDAVLADMKVRPTAWRAARTAAQIVILGAAWDAAREAAREAARVAARVAAWASLPTESRKAVWDAAWEAAQGAARDAIRALIAWDNSADLLDLPPDVLRTMADLAPEPVNHQAVLLLPYAIVREGE